MIRINLARKKVAPGSVVGDAAGTSPLSQLDLSDFQELPLRQIVVALLVVVVSYYFLGEEKDKKLQAVNQRIAQQDQKLQELEGALEESSRFEAEKEALEEEQSVIEKKIAIIEEIIEGREESIKLLVAVSAHLPEEVWLHDFDRTEDAIGIQGGALDYNSVTEFMKNLSYSEHLANVELGSTQQKDGDRQRRRRPGEDDDPEGSTEFNLTARMR